MPPDPTEPPRDLAGLRLPSPAPEPGQKPRRPFSAKVLFRRLLIVTLLLVALVLAADFLGKPFARCMHLRHTIKDALASATQVRLIEHSNYWDTDRFTPPFLPLSEFHEKVYATVTLTPRQIAQLRASLPISLDFGNETKCRFQDHHRIEALQPDGTTFTLALCFRCKELSAAGEEKHIFPLRWEKPLKEFITSLGLKPDGPWENK
ncbi:hypothetical protein BH09VER1_BH09VER1_48560 [soil metagenome]